MTAPHPVAVEQLAAWAVAAVAGDEVPTAADEVGERSRRRVIDGVAEVRAARDDRLGEAGA